MSGQRKPQNPVIGHWTCPMGGVAEVRQASKRGRHLYTQCECCGVQMGAAKARQTKIWREAEFSPPDGVTVYKPSNVTDEEPRAALPHKSDASESESEAVETEKPEAVDRWKPGESDAAESEPPSETSSGNKGALVALGVAVLAAIGGAWMS